MNEAFIVSLSAQGAPSVWTPLINIQLIAPRVAGWLTERGGGLGFTGPLVLSGSLLLSRQTEASVWICKTSQLDLSRKHCVSLTLLKTHRLDANRGVLLYTTRARTPTEIYEFYLYPSIIKERCLDVIYILFITNLSNHKKSWRAQLILTASEEIHKHE